MTPRRSRSCLFLLYQWSSLAKTLLSRGEPAAPIPDGPQVPEGDLLLNAEDAPADHRGGFLPQWIGASAQGSRNHQDDAWQAGALADGLWAAVANGIDGARVGGDAAHTALSTLHPHHTVDPQCHVCLDAIRRLCIPF